MTIFFSSDHHFFHKKIIEYTKRPFSDVDHMNESMISNWNSVVRDADIVYYLGDFSFGLPEQTQSVLSRLKGKKHLILGNHDVPSIHKRLVGWEFVYPYYELKQNRQLIVLMHYSMRVWAKAHYGSIQLYGHSHGSLQGTSQSLDVGVDCWDYTPCSLEQVKERLSTLPTYVADPYHASRPQRGDS